ncbi:substrate-binding protein [Rhodopila globiformis]|uniref:Branched-chain amino acid ABC transporter substrate-binding protein n=1 Tax=Rhodopila globiformis TaxID=1071 RepID=A0A2S6MXL0_RHOGL|nr:substrate-binding protein [Rhodopila globiformis]PPQ27096.1 branched-chain amino acid ABC transporter substrate-binding protein [Rhodopila globiformis]
MAYPRTVSAASRRGLLRAGAGAFAGGLLQAALPRGAFAAEQPPLGTWPAGVSGSSVFVGICLPRTGTYAAPGEDELKGFELAIEQLNNGDPLIRQISPHTTKGVLGKEVKHGVADSEAKPNAAVQAQSRFISEDKAIMICGSVSSAVAVALNKLAEREKVLYLPGVSGSNDTTGKDCSRYSFRQCFYAYTAANALSPVLIKSIGRNKKIAFLTPDYTYGHTVRQSTQEFLRKGGWTVATNQVYPLGASDFSSYMLNIANSGADVFINIAFGNDAVQSIKQAKQFGVLDKMTLVMAYNTPFLARDVGPDIMQGVYAATDFWWTLEDRFPVAKGFVAAFDKKYGYKPEWPANSAYMQVAMWADAVERAKSFYPVDVIKAYEAGQHVQSTVGEVWFRAADHQLVRPVIIVRGKKKSEMKGPDDYYDVLEVVPGENLMQPPDAFGCHLGAYT